MPRLASGEWLAAWALDGAGLRARTRAMRETTAVKKGDRYVLNGNKTFITNGHYADVAVVIAVTDKTKGTHGLVGVCGGERNGGFRGRQEGEQAGACAPAIPAS